MMMTRKKEIWAFGMIISVSALIIFTVLSYVIMGWWCLMFGPMVTLFSLRPRKGSDLWLWQV